MSQYATESGLVLSNKAAYGTWEVSKVGSQPQCETDEDRGFTLVFGFCQDYTKPAVALIATSTHVKCFSDFTLMN